MSNVDKRIEEIKNNLKIRASGIYSYIPFDTHFPALCKVMPGFIPGKIYHLLAGTNIGKSSLAKYLSIVLTYEASLVYKFKYKVLYFALEESEEEFINKVICYVVYRDHGIRLDANLLDSYSTRTLTYDELSKIEQSKGKVKDMLENVIISDTDNPTGLYKECHELAGRFGTHKYKHKKTNKIVTTEQLPSDPVSRQEYTYDSYEQTEKVHLMVVCDQLNNLVEEKSSFRADNNPISLWSSVYCVKTIAKKMKFIVFNIQQIALANEDINHMKEGKTDVSLQSAGDNKLVVRDSHFIFGLNSPTRFGIPTSNGHDIRVFGNAYRKINVLKNRIGKVGSQLDVFFDGASMIFEELPPLNKTTGVPEEDSHNTKEVNASRYEEFKKRAKEVNG